MSAKPSPKSIVDLERQRDSLRRQVQAHEDRRNEDVRRMLLEQDIRRLQRELAEVTHE